MSQNSSRISQELPADESVSQPRRVSSRKWWLIIALPAWVFGSFIVAQLLAAGLLWVLHAVGVPLGSLNESVLNSIFAVVIYGLTLALVIGLPWLIKKRRISRIDLGIGRLPNWTDIWMTPIAVVVYFILSSILILAATTFLPWFDVGQAQDTGFNGLSQRYEYILAFITLVILAPIAEEVLFRGYLFGQLKKYIPVWIAVLVTSLLFGAVHGAWNVAIDTFALSIILCLLRMSTGSIWAPVLVHMTKNAIAFYILFINPMLLNTLGG